MSARCLLPAHGKFFEDISHVFIHDCARPLVRVEQLVALHKIVRREDAVVLAHRVTDTIKEHRGEGRLRTLDRSHLWAMETPQVFSRKLLCRAYDAVAKRKLTITDDAAAVELLKHPIALLENPHPNPKLTTPADLAYPPLKGAGDLQQSLQPGQALLVFHDTPQGMLAVLITVPRGSCPAPSW